MGLEARLVVVLLGRLRQQPADDAHDALAERQLTKRHRRRHRSDRRRRPGLHADPRDAPAGGLESRAVDEPLRRRGEIAAGVVGDLEADGHRLERLALETGVEARPRLVDPRRQRILRRRRRHRRVAARHDWPWRTRPGRGTAAGTSPCPRRSPGISAGSSRSAPSVSTRLPPRSTNAFAPRREPACARHDVGDHERVERREPLRRIDLLVLVAPRRERVQRRPEVRRRDVVGARARRRAAAGVARPARRPAARTRRAAAPSGSPASPRRPAT